MNWHKLEDKKPIATESGHWDGLRSGKILVFTKNREYYVATMYEGIIDGSEFCDFYDGNDFEIKDVVYWTDIVSSF